MWGYGAGCPLRTSRVDWDGYTEVVGSLGFMPWLPMTFSRKRDLILADKGSIALNAVVNSVHRHDRIEESAFHTQPCISDVLTSCHQTKTSILYLTNEDRQPPADHSS